MVKVCYSIIPDLTAALRYLPEGDQGLVCSRHPIAQRKYDHRGLNARKTKTKS